jgi:hypothetical protein
MIYTKENRSMLFFALMKSLYYSHQPKKWTLTTFPLVCMFDKFHLMLNFKFKVSHDVSKNKNECQLPSNFYFKCHLNIGLHKIIEKN